MKHFILTFGLLLSFIYTATLCESAELSASKVEQDGTTTIGVKFSTTEASDLAGIKVVLHFDSKKIQYKDLIKSKETQSMMHVVNDKKPGILIIVMASATGQKTSSFELFTVNFEKLTQPDKQTPLEIELKNVEMMSASLVEIPCSTKIFRLE